MVRKNITKIKRKKDQKEDQKQNQIRVWMGGLRKIRESSRRSKTKSNLGLDTIDRPGLPSPPPCVSQCQSSSS